MINKISNFLKQFDLDVRKTNDARFMDQKCTPDVICFIADCIVNVVHGNDAFAVDTIWDSFYFSKNVRAIYNKPFANEQTAHHEYDKFIQQPLRMLASAHVLNIWKDGNKNLYSINNSEILDYIAIKERNAYQFLTIYLEKVLRDSGQWDAFKAYFDAPDKDSYMVLRDKFIRFMTGHTAINTAVEVRRIFPKILNVFAVEYHINGSEKGHMSQYAFSFSDLMYNRENWRDVGKDKSETRQQAATDEETASAEAFNAYYVQKAISQIRKIHKGQSEVHDQWGTGEATQVHHIFPKSQYPSIATYLENLILLTATQHNTKAHPHNNTQIVDKDYQLVCLLAKSDSIEKSIKKYGETYYNKSLFLYVIYVGLNENILPDTSFDDIRRRLIYLYNAA